MAEAAAINELVDSEEMVSKPTTALRLCKGTMPSVLVWYIKFFEEGSVTEIAKKYFTTPGKINDIKTDSNQKYIVKGMSFTQAEVDEAKEWVKKAFVAGQNVPGVPKRQLATTKPGDEAYVMSVLDSKVMTAVESLTGELLTLVDARAAYNSANPRATRAVKNNGDDELEEGDDELEEGDDELDDLLN